MSKTGHRNLGSFLRNVLDSSQELTKIRNEVRAHEELDNAVRQHPVDNEYSQPRQKRKAKLIPEVKIADKATKDPHMLRRVLNLYMKRAQMFRHGKGQNFIEDSQQKLSESRGKREFHSTYVVIPSGDNLQKNSDKFGQECSHKHSSCGRKNIRRRRWRGKNRSSEKSETQNINNEKSSSVVDHKMDIVNREAAAASDIQSNYPLSNTAQKGTSDVQNKASYQENTLRTNSMLSKQSGNEDLSANSLTSVVAGSGYDLDCVHEIPSLEGHSRNFKGSSSLIDSFSNANHIKSTNDIAINGQETPLDSKSSLVAQTENLNDQKAFSEIAIKQKGFAETPEQTSFNSDGASSGEALAIVNPIVLEVLDNVSKASNETSDNDGGIEGGRRLATAKTMSLPEAHEKIQAKISSVEKMSGQKSTFLNKYESKAKDSVDKNEVATLGSLFQKSLEDDLEKKQSLKSKTFQTSRENGQSVKSNAFQISHENDLTKSLSNSGHDLSGKSGHKQERVPINNIKGKASQIQNSKWSKSSSVQKASNSINKPIYKSAAAVTNLGQKALTHSGQQKLEKVKAPISLYSKNHATLPKSKLDSDIILRTELLHSSKSDKASVNQAKTKSNAKRYEVSLKQKSKNIKQKRNTVDETSRIHKSIEDVELKDDINKRNSREINDNTPKQQNSLGFSANILGENEGILKSSDADGNSFTSESHDHMYSEEAGQSEDTENNQQLMKINKRSLILNEGRKQEESVMTGDAQKIAQENDPSVDHQNKFSESLRRKRHASRFRKHLRKGKRQYSQEADSKLSSGGKNSLTDYNVSPYKNIAKHTESENREDNVHKNMLRQVEDMILALKEENHEGHLKYGNGYSQRIGRRLHSMATEEAADNSDGSSDNDDYYYYDEADVDKRRPEHSKVSQKLNRKETLDKLGATIMRRKQLYVQKQFGGTEYLNTENPTDVDYSNDNDPSLNPSQSEQVFSELITSESNKISHFNKEMPEEVLEARYNRSVIQNESGRDYEENIMENNKPQSSSSRRTEYAIQNSSGDKNNPKRSLRRIITGKETQPITRLNEGHLKQLNNALNEIVLNQTATSWNDIGQDEIGYNAHMRYKRASNVHEIYPFLKSDGVLSPKREHVAEKVKEFDLEKSTNMGENEKENTFLANGNLTKTLKFEKGDKNFKITTSQSDRLSIKNSSNLMMNKSNTLNDDTASNYTKNALNRHNLNNHKGKITESNWNTVKNNNGSSTKKAEKIPLSKNNRNTAFIGSVQNGEFNVSDHSNVTIINRHSLQHLQNFGLSTEVNASSNYNEDILTKSTNHLENIIAQHENENKEFGDLQGFNSSRYSYDENKIEYRRNKPFGIEEKMLNESIKKVTESDENSKYMLGIEGAKGNMTHYESVSTEKQHLAQILQDSFLSANSMAKKEMSLESSKALLRIKRNGEEYTDQTLEELPDYSDYTSDSEIGAYTHKSTSGDAIILHIVLDTTESTNESAFPENTNTTLGAIQHNPYNIVGNSNYVTSPIALDVTDARETSTSPEPHQGDSDKQNSKKISSEYQSFNDNSIPTSSKVDQGKSDVWNAEQISVVYQPFNMPKDYNDNSQLNNTINGVLASKMIDLVFEAVNASENLKRLLGGTLKKSDYGNQEKQPSYETGISQEMLEKEEEQYHQKTGSLLSKVMELLDVLVEEEVSKRSCISLQPELHEFLLWMLKLPEPGKLASSEFSVPDNFLFMKRNKRPHDKTKENESGTVSVSNQNMDVKELNQQIELLRELIAEYLQLTDSEKAKVSYVHAFLTEQLQALERIRHSETVGFRSKVDDESFTDRLSKSRLQGTKGMDVNLNTAKNTHSKLRNKEKQHNLPNETPFKDTKRLTSPKQDNIFSNIKLEHEKSSYASEDFRHNSFKAGSKRSAHRWSKGRQYLMKDMTSESKNADTSESHNPVHLRNPIRAHQRQRRYGGHGHGASKNKHRNITRLHVPTMRYRKLLKRAAEFRERRSGLT